MNLDIRKEWKIRCNGEFDEEDTHLIFPLLFSLCGLQLIVFNHTEDQPSCT